MSRAVLQPQCRESTGIGFDDITWLNAESRPELSFEEQEDIQLVGIDWQTRGPVETGAIPGAAVEESWMKDYGND